MTADMFTKAFSNAVLWNRLRMLINVYEPKEIEDLDLNPSNDNLPARANWENNLKDWAAKTSGRPMRMIAPPTTGGGPLLVSPILHIHTSNCSISRF